MAAKKSKVWRWAKRQAKAQAKRSWANHKKNAKARAKGRAKVRKNTPPRPPKTGSFWSRHPLVADVRDWVTIQTHSFIDKRDLRGGTITQAEMEALDSYDSAEEWLLDMHRLRKEEMQRQAARRRDEDSRSRLTLVYGNRGTETSQVKHTGFRPPAARKNGPGRPAPWSAPPPRAPRLRKRKNRVQQIVTSWKPQLDKNASIAMAADADLSGAIASLQAFVEQFPETRTQIHDSSGKFGVFGKSFSGCMQTYRAVLAAGKGEDNPGLPSEVLAHLAPLEEIGEEIVKCTQAFLAAWEDYFQDAIKAAQDEHTPSKAALTS
jgi:TolA-binding protein